MVLSTNDHHCQSNSVTFECSVRGGIATVFQGSALNCYDSSNEISLLHSRYNTITGTNGTCNDRVIVARSVSIESNCYTSTLNVTFISPDIIGRTIKCLKDDGVTSTLIGIISVPSEASIKGKISKIGPYNYVYIKFKF
jgi:hypothetical protein